MRVAYICEPHLGGAFSFFRHLRPAIAKHGVDLMCVPPVPRAVVEESVFAKLDGLDSVELPDDLPGANAALVRQLAAGRYDVVLTLPSCGVLGANLPRYLPAGLRCAVRVPMMSRGAYAPTAAVEAHADRIVAVSDRVAGDLVQSWRLPADKVATIYNGVDLSRYAPRPPAGPGPVFRILYAGRLSDLDKGVLLLPPMLEQVVRDAPAVELLVAGEGPDEKALREAFARRELDPRVRMLGAIDHAGIDRHFYEADCFVLPSRLEGCPNAMMEAMAAGCVPVAAGIRGSVDRIVEDGISGLLFRVGDAGRFADQVLRLHGDRDLWQRLSRAGRKRIEDRFTVDRMAGAYAALFGDMLKQPSRRAAPLPLAAYDVPRGMRPTWRTRVPVPLKNLIRTWFERLGIST